MDSRASGIPRLTASFTPSSGRCHAIVTMTPLSSGLSVGAEELRAVHLLKKVAAGRGPGSLGPSLRAQKRTARGTKWSQRQAISAQYKMPPSCCGGRGDLAHRIWNLGSKSFPRVAPPGRRAARDPGNGCTLHGAKRGRCVGEIERMAPENPANSCAAARVCYPRPA
jgi:hypothetical protein